MTKKQKSTKAERPVPPMGPSGMDIDPQTLRPVSHLKAVEQEEKVKEQAAVDAIHRAEQDIAQSQMMTIKLSDAAGEENFVLRTILARLEARIEALIDNDSECKCLIDVIQAVGYHVKAAPDMALKILETHLGPHVKKSIMGAALHDRIPSPI